MTYFQDVQAPYLTLAEQGSTPATPGAGLVKVYRKNDNKLYVLDEAAAETEIGAGGGGSTIETEYQTGSYTPVLADAGKVIEIDSASPATLTIPAGVFPLNTVLGVYAAGAGVVTVAPDTGVTVHNAGDLAGQYSEASLRQRATDEWVLTGDLATAGGTAHLKDYVEVIRTAGDVTLNSTAIAVVHTALDLVIAADTGDLIEYGIQGIVSPVATAATCFDVYTMPSGSTVNPFGAGLSASAASTQGVPGWSTGNSSTAMVGQLTGAATRIMVSGDVSGGATTLRLLYVKTNTTARVLNASANVPVKVWAKNYGQV